eukprot:12604368-Prorocentrum_lima.AAC.1
MADAAIPPIPIEVPRGLVEGEELSKEQLEAMSDKEKKDLSERIRKSKNDAHIKWERRWKEENPSVMPRTFSEADTGAAG